jgi:hypothetical protein
MHPRSLFRRISALLHRGSETDDLREEMALHLELRKRKLLRAGLQPANAGLAAKRQFGNVGVYQDQISALWGWTMWERFFLDVRHGARTLIKAPGFTAVAVLTLALGLGINTAIFTAVSTVILRPLPYPQPQRLISLWEENTRPDDIHFSSTGAQNGAAGAKTRTTVSVANIPDYLRTGVFESLASYDAAPLNLTGNGHRNGFPARLSRGITSRCLASRRR